MNHEYQASVILKQWHSQEAIEIFWSVQLSMAKNTFVVEIFQSVQFSTAIITSTCCSISCIGKTMPHLGAVVRVVSCAFCEHHSTEMFGICANRVEQFYML